MIRREVFLRCGPAERMTKETVGGDEDDLMGGICLRCGPAERIKRWRSIGGSSDESDQGNGRSVRCLLDEIRVSGL